MVSEVLFDPLHLLSSRAEGIEGNGQLVSSRLEPRRLHGIAEVPLQHFQDRVSCAHEARSPITGDRARAPLAAWPMVLLSGLPIIPPSLF